MAAEPRPPSHDERLEAAGLDRRILDLLERAGRTWEADAGEVDALLLDLFTYQARWNPAYGRYAAARGAAPGRLARWQEIPPVPARAFAMLRMATFPPEARVRTFRSSGTAGGPRSTLELDTLEIYDAALLPAFVRHLLPEEDPAPPAAWLALLPDPAEVEDSSLAYMVGAAAQALGAQPTYWVRQSGQLDLDGAIAHLRPLARAREPVLVLGTSIALLAVTDALASLREKILLPEGSRIMETGGFKGRRRAVHRHELYAAIEEQLGVPGWAVVGEYGMTEMVSQFYDTTVVEHLAGTAGAEAGHPEAPRPKAVPPWVRSLVLDPVTLEPVGDGEEGVLLHADAAARSSAAVLLTEDRARRRGERFEILGRMPGAEARGCSLALDDILRQNASI